MTGFNFVTTCVNCGKEFRRAKDESMDSAPYCGPCARHFLKFIEDEMEKKMSELAQGT